MVIGKLDTTVSLRLRLTCKEKKEERRSAAYQAPFCLVHRHTSVRRSFLVPHKASKYLHNISCSNLVFCLLWVVFAGVSGPFCCYSWESSVPPLVVDGSYYDLQQGQHCCSSSRAFKFHTMSLIRISAKLYFIYKHDYFHSHFLW